MIFRVGDGDGGASSLQKLNEIAFVLLSIRPILLCNPPPLMPLPCVLLIAQSRSFSLWW